MKNSFFLSLFLGSACRTEPSISIVPPNKVVCDTTQITYSKNITKLMDENCNVCHSSSAAIGGIILDKYTPLKTLISNGRFMGAIQHQIGYKAMPLGAPQLDSCTKMKIGAWVSAGAINN